MPQEIVIKRKLGFSWSQEVGIAVALLSDMHRDDLIDWVKRVSRHCRAASAFKLIAIFSQTLLAAAKDREALIEEVDQNRDAEIDALEQEEDEDDEAFERRKMSARTAGPSAAAKEAIQDHQVLYEDDSERDAATRHIQLKLLLRLLKWESVEAEDMSHLEWTIPSILLPTDLRGYIKIIDDFLINPLDPENGMSLSEMVTKKAKPRRKPQLGNIADSSSDDDGLDFSDPEVAAAIRGNRKKRTGKSSKRRKRAAEEVDGEEGMTRKRKAKRRREAEEYRTAEFIEDSDDDDEADKAFFERERRLREEMEQKSGQGNGLVERKTKEKKKRRTKGEVVSASQVQASQALSDSEDEGMATQEATQKTRASSSSASSDSDNDEPLADAKKTRPKARSKGTVAKRTDATPAVRPGGSSERENHKPASASSSPASSSGQRDRSQLKRTRGLLESSDVEEAAAASSPKLQATAGSRVNNRRKQIVASDDEED